MTNAGDRRKEVIHHVIVISINSLNIEQKINTEQFFSATEKKKSDL